jgi:hypothetical protein
MYRCFAVLFAALTLFVPGSAHAQQDASPPLTLKVALQEALRANPELVALQRDYDAMHAAVPGARYFEAPMFETQIWAWPVTTVNPARTDMYMFMGEQELPGRGKRAARELVAERETDMSRQQVAVRANEILNEVKQAYVELLLARGTAALYEQQTPVLRQMADAATARYATGQAGQYDTVNSVLELSRLQADAVEWRERTSIAEARLNTLLGRAPDSRVAAVGANDLPAVDLVNAEQIALTRHPEVVMASATVAREEAELARIRGERKPDFVVGGGYIAAARRRRRLDGASRYHLAQCPMVAGPAEYRDRRAAEEARCRDGPSRCRGQRGQTIRSRGGCAPRSGARTSPNHRIQRDAPR